MDMYKWALAGNAVILVPFFICFVSFVFVPLGNKKKLVLFELYYSTTIIFGAFISTFSAMIDNRTSKVTYVVLNLVYSVLAAFGVGLDIAMEIWVRRNREYYLGNSVAYAVPNERYIEEGIEAAERHWYISDRPFISRLTFRNWVRILLCIAGVGLAVFELIWRTTWASLDIGCLSLLPVTMALDIVATRAHKLYVGTVRVSIFTQYLGLGSPPEVDNPVFNIEVPRNVRPDAWLEPVIPLYSGCIRSVHSCLPHEQGALHVVGQALRSTFTSYTVDIMINNRRTPFTFIERISAYDSHDWAIPKVDAIVLSFSLVDRNIATDQQLENKIMSLRTHAPGVPMLLVGDMDRHRADVWMTELQINQLVVGNATWARNFAQRLGLECYMGVNHRSARFGDLLVSTLALYCSLY